jgi:DNA-binding protein Fis
VTSVGNLASSAGSSLGINRDTLNQAQDQVKSAAGYVPSVVSSGIKSTANVVNSSVASVGNLASSAGSSLGINRDTLNQAQDQVKSAAGYVTQWWWK